MNSSHLMCHFDDGISLIPCSFFFYWPCFQIGVSRFSLVICLMEDFISVVKYSPRFLAVGDSNDDQRYKSQVL